MTASAISPVAQEILSYLLSHSEAEDTIEGIVEWWLLQERIRHRKNEVQAVLDDLVAQSLITSRKTSDSRTRYRINPRNLDRIRELVK